MTIWRSIGVGVLAALGGGGCAAQPSREAQNETLRQEVSREVARICGLPSAERQAEVERTKRESGINIVCPER